MTDKKRLLHIISERLRYERQEMARIMNIKITQSDVARAVGISRSHLAAAEAGHALLSLEALIELAKFYGVSVDSMVGMPTPAMPASSRMIQSEEEVAFLRALRAMNDDERHSLMVFFSRMIQQAKVA